MPRMIARIERAGLRVDAVFGDYQGGRWTRRAEAWLIIARKAALKGRSARDGLVGSQ